MASYPITIPRRADTARPTAQGPRNVCGEGTILGIGSLHSRFDGSIAGGYAVLNKSDG